MKAGKDGIVIALERINLNGDEESKCGRGTRPLGYVSELLEHESLRFIHSVPDMSSMSACLRVGGRSVIFFFN